MKVKEKTQKLSINKKTIARLENREMGGAKVGDALTADLVTATGITCAYCNTMASCLGGVYCMGCPIER